MKLAVEFPSVAYREGAVGVQKLARAIERIGYDQLDMFDHVIMGYPTATRRAPMYPPQMPILEALMTLSYAAAVTEHIGLGTEVLVLPQRQPVLVAKQVSTLDTLSGGRVRLGVGVGWQAAEYEALGEEFGNRGQRMDEAIVLLRHCWRDSQVQFDGEFYRADAIAMEPKPSQGRIPIWIGGNSDRALRRVGELGDGWLATAFTEKADVQRAREIIERAAVAADRDPSTIGYQMMIDVPPRDASGKAFYQDMDRVAARAEFLHDAGFQWGAVNATAIFQAGARSVDAIIDVLARVHDRLRGAR
jgi:probable F420-dependent oxidoreductase